MAPRQKIRNIGIMAHIDAGKTTVSERMLFYSHKEHRIGDVDSGTATMDWMPEEQERGITITAAATTFYWNDYRFNLIDTPGHVDFTAEVERALRVLDGAVGVFCGTAGVQAQSETVWRQADRYNVPRLAFVNKLDRVGSDFFRAVESIRSRLRANAVPIQISLGAEKGFVGVIDLIERKVIRFDDDSLGEKLEEGEIPPEYQEAAEGARDKLVEAASEFDDELLETYLSGEEVDTERLHAAIRVGTLSQELVPVLCGAALRNKGVQPLMDAVCRYLPAPEDAETICGTSPHSGKEVIRQLQRESPLAALTFKTVADPHGDLVYVRIYSGVMEAGAQVYNSRTEKKDRAQKIYLMHANDREAVEEAGAGEIVAVVGFKDTSTGDSLSVPSTTILLEPPTFPETVVSMAIEPVTIADRDRLLESLEKLQREDPTFRWRSDKETGQLIVSGMGELHLEVLKDRLLREFRVEAVVGTPRVAYRQTIRKSAVGRGVFEKQVGGKTHYAVVNLRVEPDPEAAHPSVESHLTKEAVPLEFHPAIEDGARGALAAGGILGFPLIQLRVVVSAAEFRPGESSLLAYTAAASRAFDQALEVAETVVLEPIMAFEIEVPEEYYGSISGDFVRRRAVIQDVELEQGLRLIRGTVPLAEVFGYSNTLRSLSQGRGTISLEPQAYAPVPEGVAQRFRF